MARLFSSSNPDGLICSKSLTVGQTLTLSAWIYPTAAIQGFAVSLGNTSSNADFWGISARNDAGSVVQATCSGSAATSSITAPLNTWTHIAGVFVSSNNRSVFVNGGGKVSNSIDTINIAPNQIMIGDLARSARGAPFSGAIAECGFWNIALTDDEIISLAKRWSPRAIRPSSLMGYWKLLGNQNPEPDYWRGDLPMSFVNSPTKATNPPAIISYGG